MNVRTINYFWLILLAVIGPFLSLFHAGVNVYGFRVWVVFLVIFYGLSFQLKLANSVRQLIIFFSFWFVYSLIQYIVISGFFSQRLDGADTALMNNFFLVLMGVALLAFFRDFSKEKLLAFSHCWCFVALLAAVAAIYELWSGHFVFGHPDIMPGGINIVEFLRRHHERVALVSFSNQNDLAVYFSASIAFAIYAFICAKPWSRFVYFLLIMVFLACIYENLARLSLLLALLFILLAVAYYLFERKVFILVSSLLLIILFVLPYIPWDTFAHSAAAEKLSLLARAIQGDDHNQAGSILSRLGLYMQALSYFVHSYCLGIGPNGFYNWMVEGYNYWAPFAPPNPHSFYLGVLAESGIFVFLGFAYILWYVFSRARVLAKPEKILLFSLLLWNVLGSFESSSSFKTPVFWLAFFLMCSVAIYYKNFINGNALALEDKHDCRY